MMSLMRNGIGLLTICTLAFGNVGATESLPTQAPRTFVLAGEREAFRDYNLTGPGKDFYAQLKTEFDAKWLNAPPPAEPQEFGDPDPKKRVGDKVDKWRAAQTVCNQLAGTAEAATVIWLVSGDPAGTR